MSAAAYPGSFNPPTEAHLTIAETAWLAHDLDRVDLVISRVALAKEEVDRPLFEHRVEVLEQCVDGTEWLEVVITDAQLLVDIATGYELLIMGADKWVQIQDPAFYGGDTAARDAAMAGLPKLAVAPRPPHEVPAEVLLDIEPLPHSSTAARAGTLGWMLPAAAAFDAETGAWTDPDRYERWISGLA